MWWRRWVSPVVGSTALPGTPRALCERCMPRLEGDFLFCWTSMIGSWSMGWTTVQPTRYTTEVLHGTPNYNNLSSITGKFQFLSQTFEWTNSLPLLFRNGL